MSSTATSLSSIPDRLLAGIRAVARPAARPACDGNPDHRTSRPGLRRADGRGRRRLAVGVQDRQPRGHPHQWHGSAGMDAMVANLVRPGDRVVCGVHGLFGERMADALQRRAPMSSASKRSGAARSHRVAGGCHRRRADSRGVRGARRDVHRRGAASRRHRGRVRGAGRAVPAGLRDVADRTPARPRRRRSRRSVLRHAEVPQRAAGLAPFTLGERALERVDGSSRSWYFDLSLVLGYWRDADSATSAPPRSYHHTAPINLVYALREGLALVDEEGLDARWARHATAHEALRDALARSSASSASRPKARRFIRCSPSVLPRGSTRRRCAARCCATTASRSRAGSVRWRASCGASASWGSARTPSRKSSSSEPSRR